MMRIVGAASFTSSDRLGRHRRRFLDWKSESERRAPRHAIGPRLSAMKPNDGAANRQSQAHSRTGALDRSVTEFFEHALDVAFRDSAAVVLDGHDDFATTRLRAQPDHGS